MNVVYKTIEGIHVSVTMGMEIQSNMGVSSKELKTSLDELVLVVNPHIFDNLTTLDIKYFMTTTPQISTTIEPKMSYDIFYVLSFCYLKRLLQMSLLVGACSWSHVMHMGLKRHFWCMESHCWLGYHVQGIVIGTRPLSRLLEIFNSISIGGNLFHVFVKQWNKNIC